MPGKLAKNLKIRAAHRLHTRKVLASDELIMDYDVSDTIKDKIKRITITLNFIIFYLFIPPIPS